jgi:hypothetical protein
MSNTLRPLPGFDWGLVKWGGPDEPRTRFCSYCGANMPEPEDDFVPLILWKDDGSCAEFCNECMRNHWGFTW